MMDSEERLDLADIRLNAHAIDIATIKSNLQSIKDNTEGLRDEMKEQTRTFITAVQPVKLLTESNSRAMLEMANDLSWIKPWVRNGMIVGGGAGVVGLLTLLMSLL